MSKSDFDQLLRTFSLPFGRTLNARRAPEASKSKPRCVEKIWWIPPASLLASFEPTRQAPRSVSLYHILRQFYVINAVKGMSLILLLFYDAPTPKTRTGPVLLEGKKRHVARDLFSLEANKGDPHVLNPSQRKMLH